MLMESEKEALEKNKPEGLTKKQSKQKKQAVQDDWEDF